MEGSLLGISKAAEDIGFKTAGGRLSFETLASGVPMPCIVHWDQNHFVVYKIKKHQKGRYTIYVADPEKGLVTYIKEEKHKRFFLQLILGLLPGFAVTRLETQDSFGATGAEKVLEFVTKTEPTSPNFGTFFKNNVGLSPHLL